MRASLKRRQKVNKSTKKPTLLLPKSISATNLSLRSKQRSRNINASRVIQISPGERSINIKNGPRSQKIWTHRSQNGRLFSPSFNSLTITFKNSYINSKHSIIFTLLVSLQKGSSLNVMTFKKGCH